MKNYFQQGLQGCIFEIGFISGPSYDETGVCQEKNPVVGIITWPKSRNSLHYIKITYLMNGMNWLLEF